MKAISRIAALLLVLTLCFSIPATAEDFSYTTDDPTLLSIFDYSVAEWVSDDFNRNLLATCALMDIVLSGDESFLPILTTALEYDLVYVAEDSDMVLVFFFAEDCMLSVYYFPSSNLMVVDYFDIVSGISTAQVRMDAYKEADIFNTYYRVSASTMDEIYQMIMDIIAGE